LLSRFGSMASPPSGGRVQLGSSLDIAATLPHGHGQREQDGRAG
jgi:hypothetical protein